MDVVVWEAGTTSLTLWALPQVDVGPVRPILMTAVISLTPKPVDVLIVVGAAKVCLLHDDLVIAVPVAGGRGRRGSFHSRARSRRLTSSVRTLLRATGGVCRVGQGRCSKLPGSAIQSSRRAAGRSASGIASHRRSDEARATREATNASKQSSLCEHASQACASRCSHGARAPVARQPTEFDRAGSSRVLHVSRPRRTCLPPCGRRPPLRAAALHETQALRSGRWRR